MALNLKQFFIRLGITVLQIIVQKLSERKPKGETEVIMSKPNTTPTAPITPPATLAPVIDSQTARVNSGADTAAKSTADAEYEKESPLSKYLAWQQGVLDKLGIPHLFQDVRTDNPVLVAALEQIRAAGAPEPVRVTEEFTFPGTPSVSFRVDVYEYTANDATVRSTEYLLASYPAVVIGELVSRGIMTRKTI